MLALIVNHIINRRGKESTFTAYVPDKGKVDAFGHPVFTYQDYLAGKAGHVTVAVGPHDPRFNKSFYVPGPKGTSMLVRATARISNPQFRNQVQVASSNPKDVTNTPSFLADARHTSDTAKGQHPTAIAESVTKGLGMLPGVFGLPGKLANTAIHIGARVHAGRETARTTPATGTKLDPRLNSIIDQSINQFEAQNPGYTVSVTPSGGVNARARGGYHPQGKAMDVQITAPNGTPIPNYQSPQSFPIYQQFANIARGVQQSDFPQLNNSFRWGGYFSSPTGKTGYGAQDLMHFDLGPTSAMAAGTWANGLRPAFKSYSVSPTSVSTPQAIPTPVPGAQFAAQQRNLDPGSFAPEPTPIPGQPSTTPTPGPALPAGFKSWKEYFAEATPTPAPPPQAVPTPVPGQDIAAEQRASGVDPNNPPVTMPSVPKHAQALTKAQFDTGEYYLTGHGDRGFVYRHISQNPYDQNVTSFFSPTNFEVPAGPTRQDLYGPVPSLSPADTTLASEQQALGGAGAPTPTATPMAINPNDPSAYRPDGSLKGMGFLGPIKRPDGKISTELSIGVTINGKEMDIPSMVPTLTQAEINYLINKPAGPPDKSNPIQQSITRKAIAYAQTRMSQGKSPFASASESPTNVPYALPTSSPTPTATPYPTPQLLTMPQGVFPAPSIGPQFPQGGVSGVPSPSPVADQPFVDVSGVVPQGAIPDYGGPQFAQQTPTDFFNQIMQPPQSMDYMGGTGAPGQEQPWQVQNLDLADFPSYKQAFGSQQSGWSLSPQVGFPSDFTGINDIGFSDPMIAPDITGGYTPGYLGGVQNTPNYFGALQNAGLEGMQFDTSQPNFSDPTGGSMSVGGNMQLTDPTAGVFNQLPTDFSSLGVPGAGDVTAPIAGDPNFGAGIPGGSNFYNQIMTPPQGNQYAQTQPAAPPPYDPLSQGSTDQPGGVPTVQGTMVDPNTGAVSTFDPTTGKYVAVQGNTGGFGVGAGPSYGITAGGFSTGYTPFGGLGSGAETYGSVSSGVGPQFSGDTGGGFANATQGMLDPFAGSDPAAGSGGIRLAVPENEMAMKHGMTLSDYATQTNPYLPPPMPQQYISGYTWEHNPASSYGASTEARGMWVPLFTPGMGANMVQPIYAGHAGAILGTGTAQPAAHKARGGMIHGVDYGVDTVPALLRPGEVVFTRKQMRGLKISAPQLLRRDQKQAIQYAKAA